MDRYKVHTTTQREYPIATPFGAILRSSLVISSSTTEAGKIHIVITVNGEFDEIGLDRVAEAHDDIIDITYERGLTKFVIVKTRLGNTHSTRKPKTVNMDDLKAVEDHVIDALEHYDNWCKRKPATADGRTGSVSRSGRGGRYVNIPVSRR